MAAHSMFPVDASSSHDTLSAAASNDDSDEYDGQEQLPSADDDGALLEFSRRRELAHAAFTSQFDFNSFVVSPESNNYFSSNIFEEVYHRILRRNAFVVPRSLMVIKLQYVDRAVWLLHNGEFVNGDLTVLNCVVVLYDYFRERPVFQPVTNPKTFMLALQHKPPLFGMEATLKHTAFDLKRVLNAPRHLVVGSFSDENRAIMSENIFSSRFFKYVISKNVVGMSSETIAQNMMVKMSDAGEITFLYITFFNTVVMQFASSFAHPYTGFVVSVPGMTAQARRMAKFDVFKASAFTASRMKAIVRSACAILRSLHIPVTDVDEDIKMCVEAAFEAVLVNECLYGSEAIVDSPVLEASRVASFYKNASWLLALKIIMKYGSKTLRVFGLLKGIYDLALDFYTIAPNNIPFAHVLFMVLFGDKFSWDSHKRALNGDPNGVVFPVPFLMHAGHYTIRQLETFFVINQSLLAVPSELVLEFRGFPSMSFRKQVWLESSIPVLSEKLLYPNPSLAQDDFSSISEIWLSVPNVAIPTLSAAVAHAAPVTVFGQYRLPIERLGDAMRRIYLSAFSPTYFNDTIAAESRYYHDLKELASGKQVSSIAAVLLALRNFSDQDGDEAVDAFKRALAWTAVPKLKLHKTWSKNTQHPDGVAGIAFGVRISNVLGKSDKGGALGVYAIDVRGTQPGPKTVRSLQLFEQLAEDESNITNALGLRKKKRIPKCSLVPTNPREYALLTDALLITWFLQSPLFHRAPYNFKKLLASGLASHQRGATLAYLMSESSMGYTLNEAVISDTSSFVLTEDRYLSYINAIINTKQHGVLSLTSVSAPKISKTYEGVLKHNKTSSVRGVLTTIENVEDEKSFKTLNPAKIANVETVNILVPRERSTYNPAFLENLGDFILPMTSRRKTSTVSGMATSRLFDCASLHPKGDMLLTQSNYVGWTTLRSIFDRTFSAPFEPALRQGMAPKTLVKRPEQLVPHLVDETLNNPLEKVLLFSLVSKSSYAGGSPVGAVGNAIKSEGILGDLFRATVFANDYTKGFEKTATDSFIHNSQFASINRLEDLFGDVMNQDRVYYSVPSNNELVVEVGASPASTFLLYEAAKVSKQQKILSPLEVFRVVCRLGLSAGISSRKLVKWDNVPGGQKHHNIHTSTFLGAARSAWAPNEFYGEIDGYVSRGLDTVSLIQEHFKGNAFFHFASSRATHNVRALEKTPNETGLYPVYDHTSSERQWIGLFEVVPESLVTCRQDNVRKQWALVAATKDGAPIPPGTTIGYLGAEVNAIEMVVESADIFEPGPDPGDNTSWALQRKAVEFGESTVLLTEEVFSTNVLYPVGEYEWFQFTHVTRAEPILYSSSAFTDVGAVVPPDCKIHEINGSSTVNPTALSALSVNAYRERSIVHGYQISGVRFSSKVRYVRYTQNPALANAMFKRVPRIGLAAFGEHPMLSYWELVTLRPVEHGKELVVAVPPKTTRSSIDWRRLMITSYPVRNKTFEFGNSWGLPIKMVPNYRSDIVHTDYHISGQYAHPTISIMSPRLLTQAAESKLVPVAYGDEVADGLFRDTINEEIGDAVARVFSRSAEIATLNEKAVLFPNNLFHLGKQTEYANSSSPSSVQFSSRSSGDSSTPLSSSQENDAFESYIMSMRTSFIEDAPPLPVLVLPSSQPEHPAQQQYQFPLPESAGDDDQVFVVDDIHTGFQEVSSEQDDSSQEGYFELFNTMYKD